MRQDERGAGLDIGRRYRMAADRCVVVPYTGSEDTIRDAVEDDLRHMAGLGYEVVSQSVVLTRRGKRMVVVSLLLLGIPFLFTRPEHTLLVTYRRR